MATGKKMWVLDSWLYFVFLLADAWLAATPAALAVFATLLLLLLLLLKSDLSLFNKDSW